VRAVRIVIDDQNPSFLVAESETGPSGGESAPEASGRKSAAFNFASSMNAQLVPECHALSQVTNHAPIRPRSTPSSGLDTANQNGIISLNEMVPPATFAVRTIVFMPFTLFFDSARAIARALDSGLLLPSESLLPLQNEHR
jgi:hypothetical protein